MTKKVEFGTIDLECTEDFVSKLIRRAAANGETITEYLVRLIKQDKEKQEKK
jgi:hypothetical protein